MKTLCTKYYSSANLSIGLAGCLARRPRRRTIDSKPQSDKVLADGGRGRPRSAVGGFGARQPTTIVGGNCHEIIGKALLCVRCRRWKHSSQDERSSAEDAGKLERRASSGAAWASDLLQIRGTKLPSNADCTLRICKTSRAAEAALACSSSTFTTRSACA